MCHFFDPDETEQLIKYINKTFSLSVNQIHTHSLVSSLTVKGGQDHRQQHQNVQIKYGLKNLFAMMKLRLSLNWIDGYMNEISKQLNHHH